MATQADTKDTPSNPPYCTACGGEGYLTEPGPCKVCGGTGKAAGPHPSYDV